MSKYHSDPAGVGSNSIGRVCVTIDWFIKAMAQFFDFHADRIDIASISLSACVFLSPSPAAWLIKRLPLKVALRLAETS